MLLEGIETLRERSQDDITPIPVPYAGLADALGGGLWPGLFVVAGPAGAGKTQLLLSFALTAARKGLDTAVHMPVSAPSETSARLLGLASGHRWSHLFAGRTPIEDGDVEALTGLPLDVVASPSNPDKRLMVTDRLKAPLDRFGRQTIVTAIDAPLSAPGRVVAEADAQDVYDMLTIDPSLVNDADGVLVVVPVGPVVPDGWRSVRLALARLRYGAPRWFDLRFNGTWFEEEADEMELSFSTAP